jgi:DNA-binding response OmpR family regulator
MVQEETGEQANPLLHDAVEEVGGQGLHLLLVEDNHLVRQQTSAALERLGFSVTVCGSGRSAKRILREGEKIDVLVTDIVLPGGISGWKVAASAREQWPALPVLFISGYDPEGHWVEREENSFLLRKPFSRRCLSHALNALLKNERPVEERN